MCGVSVALRGVVGSYLAHCCLPRYVVDLLPGWANGQELGLTVSYYEENILFA